MNRLLLYLCICLVTINISGYSQEAGFICPDTVCVNEDINIQNLSSGGSTFYWNFCSGNLATSPTGVNMGNTGNLNGPVYSAIARDGENYFVFITNVNDGTLTRLFFGHNLTGTPVATNLGTLGELEKNIEGITITKDSATGNWFGMIAGGENRQLLRLSFGNSLSNTPVAANLGNISDKMSYTHTIYTFYESGNWYSLIGNSDLNTLIRLNFGNSLVNIPTATDLGNIGSLNEPVGFYPIQDNGTWYLFVVNKKDNSLSRLNFGSSLLNNPTGVKLGNPGGVLNAPRSITILRDCGQVFGFIVNEIPDDIVRLTFPNGLLSVPTTESLGNIAGFSFPHHISELFRVGDSLYTFILNVDNNSISRLCFASCNSASVSSSHLLNPPVFSYNAPGKYNVSLVVNEGMPSQSNTCKEIVAISATKPLITGDTALCTGEALSLGSVADSGSIYIWAGPNGYSSTDDKIYIQDADTSYSGWYSLITSLYGCESEVSGKNVIVIQKPLIYLGNDTTICQGQSLLLDAGNSGSIYSWNTGANTQTIQVSYPGDYSVSASNGFCTVTDTIKINDCGSELWCPTAFTPNSDGLNDSFHPKCQSFLSSYQIRIYNRWGQQVFESNALDISWDGNYNGTPCPGELYTYYISYSIEIQPNDIIRKEKRGSVMLVR
jgi:gliding motility-associated-like protein